MGEEERDFHSAAGDDDMMGLGSGVFDEEEQDEREVAQDGLGGGPEVKMTWKTFSPRQKAVKLILGRAGRAAAPELRAVMSGKCGKEVAVKDIGIFIGDARGDELMEELAKQCPVRNRVNLSAEVQLKRVLAVGAQVVEAGRMYQPISVVKTKEDGRLECTSGRHRLAFIALVYGPEARIPVYVEEMTLNEARDAVVVSNQSRPTKAREKAEHAVLQAVHGNAGASQDDLYYRTVTNKSRAKMYCVFSVVNRGYPAKLAFKVSNDSSRKEGMTTLANVECFWAAAAAWRDGEERKEFDADLKGSVQFLNAAVLAMTSLKGFDPRHHASAMALTALGKYYRTHRDVEGEIPEGLAARLAKSLVGMGEVGRQKSNRTYEALAKAVPMKRQVKDEE